MRALLCIIILLFTTQALAANVEGKLAYDEFNTGIQGFSPDPDKAKVAQTVTAGNLSAIDTTGWTAVAFSSTEDIQVYLNADSTKYMTFPADQTHVFVLRNSITAVRFKNGGTASLALSVWGM